MTYTASQRRQHFVDRVAQFRRLPHAQDTRDFTRPTYNPEVDAPILARLCVDDDARLHNFYSLTAQLSEEKFIQLLDGILSDAHGPFAVLEHAEFLKKLLANLERAGAVIAELEAIPGIVEPYIEPGTIIPPLEPACPYNMRGCIQLVKNYLVEQQVGVKSQIEDLPLSQKTGSSPHVLFMASAPHLMEHFFGRPHFDIVAELASVLYGVDGATPEAAQKARSRGREREELLTARVAQRLARHRRLFGAPK